MALDAEGNEIPESAPEPNLDQAKAFVQEQVRLALDAQVKPEPELPQEDQNKQLQDLINPFIQPQLNQATFEARNARDEASFYRNHPEATEKSDLIEKTFTDLAKAGRATTRESVNTYLEGKEAQADPAAYAAKINERAKAAQDRLYASTDVGNLSLSRDQDALRLKAFENMTTEEMETAMKGVTF